MILKTVLIVIGIVCGTILLAYLLNIFWKTRKFKKVTGGWKEIENTAWHGSLQEFNRYYTNARQYKRSGVYIHKNKATGKCYVGQSRNIFERVYREIHGKADNSGCKALFEAYNSGYEFEIILIFHKKGFPSLNKMERAFINLHDSIQNGYNKTWGNNEATGETIYK
ncbi:MAG: GIY-YIG nuclease family protein [Mycoplasmataceae bacterium]|jgi:hypothetical protein|nr:GIY-YIG nuclease family protein [Mycoplasmataceae bacterium]